MASPGPDSLREAGKDKDKLVDNPARRPSSSHSTSSGQAALSIADSDVSRSASTTPQPTSGTPPVPKDVLKFIPRQLQVKEPSRKNGPKSNQTKSNVPKGATLGPGFVDRAQQRRDREKAEKEHKEAMEHQLLAQLEVGEITDKEYQERYNQLQRGEYPHPPLVIGPILVSNTTANEQKQNVDKEFELLEAKDIKPEARRQEEKVGEAAPVPVRKQARTRKEILDELKAAHKKVGGWKLVGQPKSTNGEKVERGESNQDTHKIWSPHVSIKLNRKPSQETQRKPKVLGLDAKPREVVTERRVNDDVFSDVGEYENPFALDSDSSSEDNEPNPPPSKRNEIGKAGSKPFAKPNDRDDSHPAATDTKSRKPPAFVPSAANSHELVTSRGYFRDNPVASSVYSRPPAKQDLSQLRSASAPVGAKHGREEGRGGTAGERDRDGDGADAGAKRKLEELQRRDRRDYEDFDDGADSDDEERGAKRKRRRRH